MNKEQLLNYEIIKKQFEEIKNELNYQWNSLAQGYYDKKNNEHKNSYKVKAFPYYDEELKYITVGYGDYEGEFGDFKFSIDDYDIFNSNDLYEIGEQIAIRDKTTREEDMRVRKEREFEKLRKELYG